MSASNAQRDIGVEIQSALRPSVTLVFYHNGYNATASRPTTIVFGLVNLGPVTGNRRAHVFLPKPTDDVHMQIPVYEPRWND